MNSAWTEPLASTAPAAFRAHVRPATVAAAARELSCSALRQTARMALHVWNYPKTASGNGCCSSLVDCGIGYLSSWHFSHKYQTNVCVVSWLRQQAPGLYWPVKWNTACLHAHLHTNEISWLGRVYMRVPVRCSLCWFDLDTVLSLLERFFFNRPQACMFIRDVASNRGWACVFFNSDTTNSKN